ncbi:hypothetical protein A3F28_02240 [Candidatus Uhrbacteria bacterium RIFCSPHIGHO2_12_FULL_57_11]|uniref:Phosphomannomutase/phosphoglucomutase n=1 Tax=Candidatus Uhrbacteria bacterium RIFCSPHIGHO2_12_FULL_57_11 TaxID=1802398 RepID=A0A1F7UKV3_9BACT|nr:MAG: hypothetical protein A3F28_02240 [Candidatus Uhrbacteria bacterium RIFCSPHIGHO2_12_FULL_57_11]
MIDRSIFKAYDIRGTSPGQIDEETAYRVGQSVVEELDAHTVVIGRDMRGTSELLNSALVSGIVSRGADAVDIGLTTTPMFYFAVADYELHDAGVMVTASHNPAEYNGFKIVRGDVLPVGAGSGMEQIRDRVSSGRLPEEPVGNLVETSVIDDYNRKLSELVDFGSIRPMAVAVDAGNGMAGHTLPSLFSRLPQLSIKPLYFELDGRFPNHEANPLKTETLSDLQSLTASSGAAIGVAYDGDGDRIGFVDERGDPVSPDAIHALLSREILAARPGAVILHDVRSSRMVAEEISKAGGVPLQSRVGHAFIKRQMRETGAAFAGELSAHYYFRDFFGVECSDLVLLMLLSVLSREEQPLGELVAPLARYAKSPEINFEVANKAAAIRLLRERYAQEAESVSEIDGIRLDFADWWFNVRPSNTEPLLRLNLEAKTKPMLEEKTAEITAIIKSL